MEYAVSPTGRRCSPKSRRMDSGSPADSRPGKAGSAAKGSTITEGLPAAGLEVVEATVAGALFQQLVMVALLDHPASLQEEDEVRVGDSVQVVRDKERRSPDHQ